MADVNKIMPKLFETTPQKGMLNNCFRFQVIEQTKLRYGSDRNRVIRKLFPFIVVIFSDFHSLPVLHACLG